ncbi:stage III sporulation protein E [Candidatus Omnitrophus magneticus]|uniref:Stage III sporulation protein E n=1 Tax=Candidatus Omnitrophus magneticus TaxID=1609969 RepID=A0A0F0CPT1_9BACT|nr:stage III sporulation protein E [Candidatus Omnitrophus magneticus]
MKMKFKYHFTDVRKNEIRGVILCAVGIFIFLSLLTFDSRDIGLFTNMPNVDMSNMAGILGAYLSAFLIFFTGKASYVIPFLLIVWGIAKLAQLSSNKRFFLKIFGAAFLLISVSATLSMFDYPIRAFSFSAGGLLGTIVAEFLIGYLGTAGSYIFIITTIMLSLLIATEFLLLPVIIKGVKLAYKGGIYLKDFLFHAAKKIYSKRDKAKEVIKEAKNEVAKKLMTIKEDVERRSGKVLENNKKNENVKTTEDKAEPKIVQIKTTVENKGKIQKIKSVSVDTNNLEQDKTKQEEYKLPGFDLLNAPPKAREKEREDAVKSKAALLEKTLLEFGVTSKVVRISIGPVITLYELEPPIGTKLAKITSLADNISLSLKSANIRIVAPMPGKGTIGIEVPNDNRELVILRDIMDSDVYHENTSPLKLALGKDISGIPLVMDLAAMPHLLIAGATGAGKTVCINCIITSLLMNSSPKDLKFIMVDPKRVELLMFAGIPHLMIPIITNAKKVAGALAWLISEMERRYDLFSEKGVRNIAGYKERQEKDWENVPYVVVIIDELADLMMVAQEDIEGSIMRLAQLSRAAGIHMILATQRPSVNVITGVIKANFPARISFRVASKVDSRTILDANGAEKLLGKGDMLIMETGKTNIVRGQCSLVQDIEIKKVVQFIKTQGEPEYMPELMEKQRTSDMNFQEEEKDAVYEEAVRLVIGLKQASVSMLQRRLKLGYARAARLIDIMEQEGIVGAHNGAKPREIYVTNVEELNKVQITSEGANT